MAHGYGVFWLENTSDGPWVNHVIDYGGRTGGGIEIGVADYDGNEISILPWAARSDSFCLRIRRLSSGEFRLSSLHLCVERLLVFLFS